MANWWELINKPLAPEVQVDSPIGQLGIDILRQFTAPADLTLLTPAFGGAKILGKLPKIGEAIKKFYGSKPVQTGAKGLLSGMIAENAPFVQDALESIQHDPEYEDNLAFQSGMAGRQYIPKQQPDVPSPSLEDVAWAGASAVPWAGSIARKVRRPNILAKPERTRTQVTQDLSLIHI